MTAILLRFNFHGIRWKSRIESVSFVIRQLTKIKTCREYILTTNHDIKIESVQSG